MRLGCIADDLTGATDLALMLAREGTADRPDDRRAETRPRPLRRRCRRRGAEIPHHSGAGGRRPVPGGGRRPCARPGADASVLQVLLDLRLDRRGQYRPGHRGAPHLHRQRLHPRLPGLPGQWPHGLPGPSLRERRAAAREQHEGPPADAHAGFEPRPRAAAPDRSCSVGLVAFEDVDAGVGCASATPSRARSAAGHRIVDRRCADATRTCARSASRPPDLPLITGGSGRRDGPAGGLSRQKARVRALPTACFDAPAGRDRHPGGLLLQRHAAPGRGRHRCRHCRPSGSIPSRLHRAMSPPGCARLDAAASRTKRPILIYSTAAPDEVQAVQGKLGRMQAGEMVETVARRDRAGSARSSASRASSWRAARPRGPSSARSTWRRSPSAPRSIRACPGRGPLGGTDLALALKSGNFGAPDFFLKAWTCCGRTGCKGLRISRSQERRRFGAPDGRDTP